MPSPLGHFLAGATLAAVVLPRNQARLASKLALAGAVACVPDLDFLPMLILDLGREFHRGITHSLLFAAGGGGLLFLWLGFARWRLAAAASLALLSHCLLDAATTVRGQGLALLWPLSAERWRLGLVQLPGASIESSLSATAAGILQTASVESAIFIPPLMLALYLRHHPRGDRGNRMGLWATIRS
ncbi:MAG: metal-dependent hydrolase [Steroidobacteraceae bacterium]